MKGYLAPKRADNPNVMSFKESNQKVYLLTIVDSLQMDGITVQTLRLEFGDCLTIEHTMALQVSGDIFREVS